MKKLLALIALSLFLIPSMALAAEFKTTDVVAKEETPKNLYVASDMVTVDANTAGDLNAAGGTVIVNGNVENSANLAAGTVFLKGSVGQNVRIAGGTVNIDNTTGQDVLVFGGQVNLGSSSIVKGDLIVYGGTVTLNGRIDGNVVGSGGEVIINGMVGGDVNLKNVGTVSLTQKAVVAGDLKYSASESAKVSDGAVIKGKTDFTKVEPVKKARMSRGVSIFGVLFGIVGSFILLLVVTLLLPKASRAVVENAFKNPWANIGIGFAVLVLAPIAMIITLITLVGAPLAGVAFTLYMLAMIFGGLYAMLALGSVVRRYATKGKDLEIGWQAVAIGVVLMVLLKLIPIIGWLFGFAFFLLALGSLATQSVTLLKAQK